MKRLCTGEVKRSPSSSALPFLALPISQAQDIVLPDAMVLVRYHGNQDIAIILLVTYMVIVRLGCTLQRENQMLVYIHFVDVRLTLVREH